MQATTNYGFKKPELTDTQKVEDLNYNADLADTKIKERETDHDDLAQIVSTNKVELDAKIASGASVYSKTVDGSVIVANNANDSDIANLTVHGKSYQVGTPTSSNTVEISNLSNPDIVLGGKNVLECTLATTTQSGVTITKNADGTYTANGTATAAIVLPLGAVSCVGGVTYRLTGRPKFGGDYYTFLRMDNDHIDRGNGIDYAPIADINITVVLRIAQNDVLSNIVFKPMVSFDTTTKYEDYEQYVASIPISIPYTLESAPDDNNTRDTLILNRDGTGTLIKRVYTHTYNGLESWQTMSTQTAGKFRYALAGIELYSDGGNTISAKYIRSNRITPSNLNNTYKCIESIAVMKHTDNLNYLYLYVESCSSGVTALNAWLAAGNLKVQGILVTPIVTTLTVNEVLAIIGNTKMYSPTSTLYSSELANMSVTYELSTDEVMASNVNNDVEKNWILHLDCARKYFSVANVKSIISSMSANGFNQLQLHFSENEGFRLQLSDMTVKDSDSTAYDLSSCLGGTESPLLWYSEAEMDDIITYANGKSVEIIPSFDMPGHMGKILSVFTTFKYGITNTLDITNATAVKFALAIAEKYIKYFSSRGCKYWNIGYDEIANDSGFKTFYDAGDYQTVMDFVDALIVITNKYGMIPRVFNEVAYYNADYNYLLNKDVEILYWNGNTSTGDYANANTIQKAGYHLINTNYKYYWVLGNPAIQVTADYLKDMDLLKDFHGGRTDSNADGACLAIWCDGYTTNSGDSGNSVVASITPLIEAFGYAISNA